MERNKFTVVNVTLEDREDGGLRVYSQNLPGLILSGRSREAVWSNIAPAISALLERSGVTTVAVYSTRPLDDVLASRSPRELDLHVLHEQFVVELPESEAA
jgi:hypothetical protein